MDLMKKPPLCIVLVLVLCSSSVCGESDRFKVTGFVAPAPAPTPALDHENAPSDNISPSQSSNLFNVTDRGAPSPAPDHDGDVPSVNSTSPSSKLFQVTDFGAVPDGKTDNSKAFLKAWEKACATDGGGVLVPKGTFLLKTTLFEGPCSGETLFQVIGNLVATSDPSLQNEFWIRYDNIDGLKLSGNATFDGRGASAWAKNKCKMSSKCNVPATSISITKSKNSVISGIKSLNSKGFHMQIHDAGNLVVQNVQLSAPEDSPNTDGIHIAKSNGVRIINSKISTGDDCISIGDGNTEINITGIHCGPGHGISIGSLGKYSDEKDVQGITVTNCTFTNTDNGFRIKTWAPSVKAVIVSDVTLSNIIMDNVQNPILIDQYYCPNSQCKGKGESGVSIKNVKFIGVTGTSATDVAVKLACSKLKPCQGIELSGLELKLPGGKPTKATCSNADKTFDGADQVPATCSKESSDGGDQDD